MALVSDKLRIDMLVGFRIFLDSRNMQTAFMGEGGVADKGRMRVR